MGKEVTRKLTRDEKYAVQQSGRFWRDWLYWKESECENTFILRSREIIPRFWYKSLAAITANP